MTDEPDDLIVEAVLPWMVGETIEVDLDTLNHPAKLRRAHVDAAVKRALED